MANLATKIKPLLINVDLVILKNQHFAIWWVLKETHHKENLLQQKWVDQA